MELTVTNRSQAYPNAEKEISKQSVGLKKSKKDLQLSDECSIILYVVLKARSHTVFDRCVSPDGIGRLYMLSPVFLDSSMVEHSAVNRRVVGSSPIGPTSKKYQIAVSTGIRRCGSIGRAADL